MVSLAAVHSTILPVELGVALWMIVKGATIEPLM
jgi:hypothetical protein